MRVVFHYGTDEQRREMKVYANNALTLTKRYLGDYEEEIDAASGNIRKMHYISGAIYITRSNGTSNLYYTYTDNMGSLTALVDEGGRVERYAYDPWGVRRNPDNWALPDERTSLIVNRGYTGHEMLDKFGIINMNGRVYDPYTAQFFSPDPYVQAPSEWLNYNRYSYAMGNPFKFTDPTGEQAALNNDGTYDYWGMGGDSGWNMYPGGYNQYSSYNNSGGYSGGYSSYVYSGANPGNYAFAAFTNNPVATTYTANGNGGTAGSWTFTPAYEYRYIYDDAGNIIAIVQRMVTGITAIREKEPEMNSTARHRNVTGGSSNGGFGWSDGVGIAWTGASTYANNFMQMAAETSFRS